MIVSALSFQTLHIYSSKFLHGRISLGSRGWLYRTKYMHYEKNHSASGYSVLSVRISSCAWTRATSRMVLDNMGNAIFDGSLPKMTHYIPDVTFGDPFPLGTNPSRNIHHVINNESGVVWQKFL